MAVRRRLFPGWFVVVELALILAVAVGTTFYAMPIYLNALSTGPDEFSVGAVSVAIALFMAVSGFGGVLVARLLQRHDTRFVLVTGTLVTAAAMVSIGHVHDDAELLVGYAVLGAGFAAVSTIPVSAVVNAWFVRRRALAMSAVFTGLPLGGAVLSPVVSGLVDAHGIAFATTWLAIGFTVTLVTLAAVLRPDPIRYGLRPDGDEPADAPVVDAGPLTAEELRKTVRSRWYVLVTAALALGMVTQIGALAHLDNAIAVHVGTAAGAAAISTATAASVIGRVVGVPIFARCPSVVVTAVLLLVQGAAVIVIAELHARFALLAMTAVFGLTMGNLQLAQPLLMAERFGGRDFARLLARGNLAVVLGMAVGPVAVGYVHDSFGDYHAALLIAGLPAAVGALLIALAARHDRRAAVAAVEPIQPHVRHSA